MSVRAPVGPPSPARRSSISEHRASLTSSRIKAQSFLIDGEAVITSDDGMSDFRALRSKRRGHEAVLYAFDLIEHDGDDLCSLSLLQRKRRLAKLISVSAARHPVP